MDNSYERLMNEFGFNWDNQINSHNMGNYFGAEIELNKLKFLIKNYPFSQLAAELDQCGISEDEFSELVEKGCDPKGLEACRPKIIHEIPKSVCSKLTPNLQLKCNKAYIIAREELLLGGVSNTLYGVFGYYNGPSIGNMIINIKTFSSENEMLDFISKTSD